MNKLPVLSVDLIEALSKDYPERCPGLDMTDREVWFYAGQRDVVRNLEILRQKALKRSRQEANQNEDEEQEEGEED